MTSEYHVRKALDHYGFYPTSHLSRYCLPKQHTLLASIRPHIKSTWLRRFVLFNMSESLGPAFADRDRPLLSYGLRFSESVLKHADSTFHASRIYVIFSASLVKNTTYPDELKRTLGNKVAGVRVGMKPHSHWSEILQVVADVKKCDADLIVTLGAGSLTDAAKLVSFVCTYATSDYLPTPKGHNHCAKCMAILGTSERRLNARRTGHSQPHKHPKAR